MALPNNCRLFLLLKIISRLWLKVTTLFCRAAVDWVSRWDDSSRGQTLRSCEKRHWHRRHSVTCCWFSEGRVQTSLLWCFTTFCVLLAYTKCRENRTGIRMMRTPMSSSAYNLIDRHNCAASFLWAWRLGDRGTCVQAAKKSQSVLGVIKRHFEVINQEDVLWSTLQDLLYQTTSRKCTLCRPGPHIWRKTLSILRQNGTGFKEQAIWKETEDIRKLHTATKIASWRSLSMQYISTLSIIRMCWLLQL